MKKLILILCSSVAAFGACNAETLASASSAEKFAYIATNYPIGSGYVGPLLCTINADRTFSNCDRASTQYNNLSTTFAAQNPQHTFFYINSHLDYDFRIDVCSIGTDGKLSNCNFASTTNDISTQGTGLTFNNTGTLVYAPNFEQSAVKVCKVNQENGTFDDCKVALDIGTGPAKGINKIVLNNANNTAYILGQKFNKCDVNQNGTFGNCTTIDNMTIFPINTMMLNNSGTIAYVASSLGIGGYNGQMNKCAVDGKGLLSNCTPVTIIETDPNIFELRSITLDSAGTSAYFSYRGPFPLTPKTTNWVTKCTVDANGDFSNCVRAADLDVLSYGITL